jgi:hypothetical protein
MAIGSYRKIIRVNWEPIGLVERREPPQWVVTEWAEKKWWWWRGIKVSVWVG